MKQLTKKQFDKLITTFEKVIKKFPKAEVEMMKGDLNSCGSPMCHAGWFAVGSSITDGLYLRGSELIAKTLGFEDDEDLKSWATQNPDLWGNMEGYAMFIDGAAFGQESDNFGSLQIVIDHWKGVRDRVLGLA